MQDKSLPTGEVHKLDTSEDAWAFSAPPKAGAFELKLFLAKEGVKCYDDDKDKEPGYGIAMEAKIVNSPNGEFDGVVVFPRVATFLGRGKNISTAAGLIHKLGFKVPEEAHQLKIAQLLVQALKREPVTKVELDWRGYSKIEKRNVFRNMEAFPKDKDGEPMHIVDYKASNGQIEEIRANLDVVHWYGKGEEVKAKGPGHTGAKSAAAGAVKGPVLLSPSDDDIEASTPAAASANSTTADDLSDLEEA